MRRACGVDKLVERLVRPAPARYGQWGIAAADGQPANVAESEPLPAVRFVVGIGRRYCGVQVVLGRAHPRAVLVLLDAHDLREERYGRDVLEVQHAAVRGRGRPALVQKRLDLCVETQPVGEMAEGIGGRHAAAGCQEAVFRACCLRRWRLTAAAASDSFGST